MPAKMAMRMPVTVAPTEMELALSRFLAGAFLLQFCEIRQLLPDPVDIGGGGGEGRGAALETSSSALALASRTFIAGA